MASEARERAAPILADGDARTAHEVPPTPTTGVERTMSRTVTARWPAAAVAMVALTGCARGGAGAERPEEPGDTAPDAADTAPSESPTDADRLAALLAGDAEAEPTLHAIAWSGGFPVEVGAATWRIVVYDTTAGAWTWAGDASDWVQQPMTDAGAGLWWADISAASPAGSRYKVVRDGTDWRADPLARSYDYDGNGEISYLRPPAAAPRLDRWPDLAWPGLVERDLRVLVPPGEGPWPILVAHDGQNLFDPGGAFGSWDLQGAVADEGRPLLVVGIDHGGAARLDELGHGTEVLQGETVGGLGAVYAEMVVEAVLPHARAVYGDHDLIGTMGSSMGGLMALRLGVDHPEVFDYAASLSGALWFGVATDGRLETHYVTAPPTGLRVYADSGGNPGPQGCGTPADDVRPANLDDSDGYCATRRFVDVLAAQAGFTWNDTLFHWHEPGALHNEAAWAARVGRPLGLFLDLADAP